MASHARDFRVLGPFHYTGDTNFLYFASVGGADPSSGTATLHTSSHPDTVNVPGTGDESEQQRRIEGDTVGDQEEDDEDGVEEREEAYVPEGSSPGVQEKAMDDGGDLPPVGPQSSPRAEESSAPLAHSEGNGIASKANSSDAAAPSVSVQNTAAAAGGSPERASTSDRLRAMSKLKMKELENSPASKGSASARKASNGSRRQSLPAPLVLSRDNPGAQPPSSSAKGEWNSSTVVPKPPKRGQESKSPISTAKVSSLSVASSHSSVVSPSKIVDKKLGKDKIPKSSLKSPSQTTVTSRIPTSASRSSSASIPKEKRVAKKSIRL